MSTKIEGPMHAARPADPSAMAQAATRSGGDRSQPVSALSADSMRLTDNATDLRALQKQLSGKPAGIDMARVNALRDAISDGSYKVDAAAIADRMTRLEKDLHG